MQKCNIMPYKREHYFMNRRTITSSIIALNLLLPGYGSELPDLIYCSNGVYSILEAAAAGDTEVLKARIAEGCDVNQKDEEGNTALHLAARRNSAESLAILLKKGADPMVEDAAGKTASQLASSQKAIRVLKGAMATRNKEIELCDKVTAGDMQALEAALGSKRFNPNMLNKDNTKSLLIIVCEKGNISMASKLIKAGADVNYEAPNGRSVLHHAGDVDNAELISMLLEAGANPMAPARNGATALHDAVWSRRMSSIKALLPAYKSVNFSPDGRHNGTPIGLAIGRGFTEVVRLFIEAGIDLNDTKYLKNPPLHQAAESGRREMVELFLKAGASKSLKNKAGKTAGDVAAPTVRNLL